MSAAMDDFEFTGSFSRYTGLDSNQHYPGQFNPTAKQADLIESLPRDEPGSDSLDDMARNAYTDGSNNSHNSRADFVELDPFDLKRQVSPPLEHSTSTSPARDTNRPLDVPDVSHGSFDWGEELQQEWVEQPAVSDSAVQQSIPDLPSIPTSQRPSLYNSVNSAPNFDTTKVEASVPHQTAQWKRQLDNPNGVPVAAKPEFLASLFLGPAEPAQQPELADPPAAADNNGSSGSRSSASELNSSLEHNSQQGAQLEGLWGASSQRLSPPQQPNDSLFSAPQMLAQGSSLDLAAPFEPRPLSPQRSQGSLSPRKPAVLSPQRSGNLSPQRPVILSPQQSRASLSPQTSRGSLSPQRSRPTLRSIPEHAPDPMPKNVSQSLSQAPPVPLSDVFADPDEEAFTGTLGSVPGDATVSKSPFKVFSKEHDTFTKETLDKLLHSVGEGSDQGSVRSAFTSRTTGSTHSNDSQRTHVHQEKASSKSDKPPLTTAEILKDADNIMDRLRNNPPQDPADGAVDNDNSTSSVLDSSLGSTDHSSWQENSRNSISELENTLRQHRPLDESSEMNSYESSGSQQAGTFNAPPNQTSLSSSPSQTESRSGTHPGPNNVLNASNNPSLGTYFNSVRGTYEKSATSINPRLRSSSSERRADQLYPPKHPGMHVLTPADMKAVSLLNRFKDQNKEFDFDAANNRWRRRTSPDYGTGSTKVDEVDEADPFQDIDDLEDSAHHEKNDGSVEDDLKTGSVLRTRIGNSQDHEVSSPQVGMDSEMMNGDGLKSLSGALESLRIPDRPEPHDIPKDLGMADLPRHSREATPVPLGLHLDGVRGHITLTSSISQHREVSIKIPSETAKRLFGSNATAHNMSDSILNHGINATRISAVNSSFSDGYNALVNILQDTEQSVADWTYLQTLDLASKDLSSLLHLDEVCPRLEVLDVHGNSLQVIKGVPESLLVLDASSNMLTSLTSFKTLPNLRRLNISNNRLGSLIALSSLTHLTELNVDNNDLVSLDGIEQLRCLKKLNAAHNHLTTVDFSDSHWTELEEINLAGNRIEVVRGVEKLTGLLSLDLTDNDVLGISTDRKEHRLRRLVLCNNGSSIDVSSFTNLRELQYDGNRRLVGGEKLRRLKTLSMRSMVESNSDSESWSRLTDLERLFLSDNHMSQLPISEPFLNLHHLELSGVGLTKLPSVFAELCINLRELDLSFNELCDVRPLIGIPKLSKLYLYGNDLSSVEELVSLVEQMPFLRVLDVRANPLTSQLYPRLAASGRDMYRRSHRKSEQATWVGQESEFVERLDRDTAHLRTVYRALVLSSSKSLQWLDGSMLTSDEIQGLRRDASRILGLSK